MKKEKNPNVIIRGRKFRFYPTPEQKKKIDGTLSSCRVVGNFFIIQNEEAYQAEKAREEECEKKGEVYEKKNTYTSAFSYGKILTAMRHSTELGWLSEYSATAQMHAIMDIDKAYKEFFKCNKEKKYRPNAQKPHIKGKKTIRNSSFYMSKSDGMNILTIEGERKYVRIPTIGVVEVMEPDYLPEFEKVKSGRVCRNGEYYFISFPTEIEKSPIKDFETDLVEVHLKRDGDNIGVIESDIMDPFIIKDPKQFDNWINYQRRIDKFQEAFAKKTSINSARYKSNYRGEYKEEPDTSSKKLYHSMSYISHRMCKLRAKESRCFTGQANIVSDYYNNVVAQVIKLNPKKIQLTRPSSNLQADENGEFDQREVKKDQEERFFLLVLKFVAQCEEHEIELEIIDE